MSRVLCSTGAVIGNKNNRNHMLLPEIAKRLECDGFEFMLFGSWYDMIEKLKLDLSGMNLEFPVMHCEKKIGELLATGTGEDFTEALRKFEINCSLASVIGAEKMVMHLWNGLISDSHFENNVRAYSSVREIADKYDITLMVENVVCNCSSPMEHLKELRKVYPDISFTFDTKMAEFHNELGLIMNKDWEWLWTGNHIKHLHINDYAGGYMDWSNLRTLAIGEGHVDFDSFFKTVRKEKYNQDYTIEAQSINEDGTVDYDSINRCVRRIREEMNI